MGTCFNPRVLAGGRDLPHFSVDPSQKRFNPRVLAGGRDPAKPRLPSARSVSIHASSREDATWHCAEHVDCPVSIHASSREDATSRLPAAHDGARVSIHASSREDATKCWITGQNVIEFQSTRPRGRTRHLFPSKVHSLHQFQSTRPRGRTRPIQAPEGGWQYGFNPRVLAGGRDVFSSLLTSLKIVSIHASSREDATFVTEEIHPQFRFQSTRPRGRTRL